VAAPERRVLVIGAGPAGLSCGYRLAQAGTPVAVYEASPFVGGLCRSLDLWGRRVDLGPHRFFSTSPMVNAFWKEIVGPDHTLVDRLTRIYYGGRFFHYPLRPLNVVANLNPLLGLAAVGSYARQRLRPIPDPQSLEEWVTNRFGRRLFRMFFQTYTEKVWGIPCSRIDPDWAAQRIKGLSLGKAIRNALLAGFGNRERTLVDRFGYPDGGTGRVYERLADGIRRHGGSVHVSSPIREVMLDAAGRVSGIRLATGETVPGTTVVSTMPLTSLILGLRTTPPDVRAAAATLYYRNTILVYLDVDHDALFPDNWIYVHAPEVLHGRITNFRNWGPSLRGDARTTILCMEYWCFERDELWQRDDAALAALAETELRRIRLVPPGVRVLAHHVVKIPKSYPVYEQGYGDHVKRIAAFVERIPGLLPIGRYGSFKYNNQDHSMLMGLLAAREILTGRSEDLWNVNADDRYQEQGAALDAAEAALEEATAVLATAPAPTRARAAALARLGAAFLRRGRPPAPAR